MMNKTLENFARQQLKNNLAQCTEGQQNKFRFMYAGGNMNLTIDEVVNQMPTNKLSWAMTQVENTLTKSKRGE